MSAAVEVEVVGAVSTLYLNRPERANALDEDIYEGLERALDQVEADRGVRVVVLAARGRGFCAGANVRREAGPRDPVADHERLERMSRTFLRLWDSPLPSIAQVHGYCFMSGLDLVMLCDLAIAAEDARFGLPALRGTGGVPLNLVHPFHLGMRRTKELLWIQEEWSGVDAAGAGIVNAAVPEPELGPAVARWADRLARMPRSNVALSKRQLHRAADIAGFRSMVATGIEFDVIAHAAPVTDEWRQQVERLGLSEAVQVRDAPFEGDVRNRKDGGRA